MRTISLLLSEGYYSTANAMTLRKDLCLEAMRLCTLLVKNPQTDTPGVNALLSLMCFHTSRFEARRDRNGDLVLYDDQDMELWNEELIARGGFYLSPAEEKEQFAKRRSSA